MTLISRNSFQTLLHSVHVEGGPELIIYPYQIVCSGCYATSSCRHGMVLEWYCFLRDFQGLLLINSRQPFNHSHLALLDVQATV